MSDEKNRKTEQIAFRVTPKVKELATIAAEREVRKVSGLVERLLIEYLRREGYLNGDEEGR